MARRWWRRACQRALKPLAAHCMASGRQSQRCRSARAAVIKAAGTRAQDRARRAGMATNAQKIGWIGMGRMGLPMAERLLKAGHDVSIWNRTRAKAEPLAQKGGKVVETLPELSGVDVLFSIVLTGKD